MSTKTNMQPKSQRVNIVERQWTTSAGLPAACIVMVFECGRKNHRCGYVGVPVGHPCHGVEYDRLPAINVHGGVTFSRQGDDDPLDRGRWWIGFDCAHAGDGWIEPVPGARYGNTDAVRTQEYVEAECEALARQLVGAKPTPSPEDWADQAVALLRELRHVVPLPNDHDLIKRLDLLVSSRSP